MFEQNTNELYFITYAYTLNSFQIQQYSPSPCDTEEAIVISNASRAVSAPNMVDFGGEDSSY